MTRNSLLLVKKQLPVQNYAELIRSYITLSGRRFNPHREIRSCGPKATKIVQNNTEQEIMTSNSLLLAKKQLPVQNYAELIRTLLFKRSSVQSTPRNPFLRS